MPRKSRSHPRLLALPDENLTEKKKVQPEPESRKRFRGTPVSHTEGGGPDELPIDFIERQWLHGDIGVHRLGQRRVHVHLTLRAQQGARGEEGGRHGGQGAWGAHRRGARRQGEQRQVGGAQGLPGKAPAVKFFDLHLDAGGTAGLEEVQGLGQEFVLPSTLVPAGEAKEHLELRHPETHHHVLGRGAQKGSHITKARPPVRPVDTTWKLSSWRTGPLPSTPSVEKHSKMSALPDE